MYISEGGNDGRRERKRGLHRSKGCEDEEDRSQKIAERDVEERPAPVDSGPLSHEWPGISRLRLSNHVSKYYEIIL